MNRTEDLCRQGHWGPLCAACLDNHFKAPNGLCIACNDTFERVRLFLPLAVVTFLVLHYMYHCVLKRLEEARQRKWRVKVTTSEKLARGMYGRRTRFESLQQLNKHRENWWRNNKAFILPKVCATSSCILSFCLFLTNPGRAWYHS